MALRPGRQRSSATPIIAKGSVYPLQNRCASKLATHGFASKSDTHHKTKDHPRGGLLFWLIDGRTRKAGPEKALNGLFPAVAFPQKSESNERRNLKFFKILQMHFEHFGFVDRFEPAKAFHREEGDHEVVEGACATLKSD